ncbi:MAG: zinc ribbon domain-containing protein [Planctomycetes bacterium]|nr:zinc ribbon domain-containing protein [Planctomycetota bacterium]
MPTYEYRCEACNHKFEAFQSMSAKPVSVCPKCRKRKVKKLISKGGGLIFKGSGFYLTDYARKSGEPATKEGAAKSEAAAPAEPVSKEPKQEPRAHSCDEASAKAEATGSGNKADPKAAAPKKEPAPAKEPEKASKSAKKK